MQRGQLFRPDSLERRARHAGNGEENEEAPGEGGGEVVVCWGRTRRDETSERPTRAGGFKDGWAQCRGTGPGTFGIREDGGPSLAVYIHTEEEEKSC